MNHYVGIDVSLEASSVCVVDCNGNIACEGKVASEPNALIAWLKKLELKLSWGDVRDGSKCEELDVSKSSP